VPQFLRFSVVGAIAFVIDFGVMVALTELVGLPPVVLAA
jgi:putative flippase GtrA